MKHVASWIRECDTENFARVFCDFPELRVWNARTETIEWEQMGGLLLTGGSNICEEYLCQAVPNRCLIGDVDPVRDRWEFDRLPHALAAKIPVLAICRGLQVLNIALGGTLQFDIPAHDDTKYENVQPLRYVLEAQHQFSNVNSSHHHALDRLGVGLEVEACCATDGVIEQVHLREHPFALGVQYHPERDPLYRSLFEDFFGHVVG